MRQCLACVILLASLTFCSADDKPSRPQMRGEPAPSLIDLIALTKERAQTLLNWHIAIQNRNKDVLRKDGPEHSPAKIKGVEAVYPLSAQMEDMKRILMLMDEAMSKQKQVLEKQHDLLKELIRNQPQPR